jgi:phage-related tail fiber protein
MSLFEPYFRDEVSSPNPQTSAQATANEFDSMSAQISAWALVQHNPDGTHNISPSGFAFVPIGAIMVWPSATPPKLWLVCNGAQVSRLTYQSLYSVIGTTFGIGDGSTTFNLPNPSVPFSLTNYVILAGV